MIGSARSESCNTDSHCLPAQASRKVIDPDDRHARCPRAPNGRSRPGRPVGRRRRWVFAVIAVGAFMAQLDLFIVNIAFPRFSESFPGELAVVALVGAQRLRDRLRRLPRAGRQARRPARAPARRSSSACRVRARSAACAAAPTLGVLVAARAVQAVGAALLIPTSLGLLLHAFPPARRAGGDRRLGRRRRRRRRRRPGARRAARRGRAGS